jgi:hypothetical protein
MAEEEKTQIKKKPTEVEPKPKEEKKEEDLSLIDVRHDAERIVDKLYIKNLYNESDKSEFGLLTDTDKTDLTDAGDTNLHTHGGVANTNLVDKSASESISGTWTYSNTVTLDDADFDMLSDKVDTAGLAKVQWSKKRLSSPYTVQEDDQVLAFRGRGYDGDKYVDAVQVLGYIDGTAGNDNMPGRLSFRTTVSGAVSPTEQMRIDNAGTVTIYNSTLDMNTHKIENVVDPTANLLESSTYFLVATSWLAVGSTTFSIL